MPDPQKQLRHTIQASDPDSGQAIFINATYQLHHELDRKAAYRGSIFTTGITVDIFPVFVS
jgi:hypothetical protein